MTSPLLIIAQSVADTTVTAVQTLGAGEYPASTLLTYILLGLSLGSTGQGARSIVGWKKLHDDAANTDQSVDNLFRARELVVSFAIGAVAGVFAALGLLFTRSPMDGRSIITIIAAGYTGADFIEGFATQWLRNKVDQPSAAGPNSPAIIKEQRAGTSGSTDSGSTPVGEATPRNGANITFDDDPNSDAALAEGHPQG